METVGKICGEITAKHHTPEPDPVQTPASWMKWFMVWTASPIDLARAALETRKREWSAMETLTQ